MELANEHSPCEMGYQQEIKRKLIHLSSLWMPVLIYGTGAASIPILTCFWLLVIAYEGVRRTALFANSPLVQLLEPILRPHEKTRFGMTGASYVLLAAICCAIFFTDLVSATALIIMLVGDTAASLVGRRWGKLKLWDKTVEGSAAFFSASIISVSIFGFYIDAPAHYYTTALGAAIVGTIVEAISGKLRLDDNLTVALSAGAFMQIFYHF